jgi:hypothetical protein
LNGDGLFETKAFNVIAPCEDAGIKGAEALFAMLEHRRFFTFVMFTHSGVEMSDTTADVKFFAVSACELVNTISNKTKVTCRDRTVIQLTFDRFLSFPIQLVLFVSLRMHEFLVEEGIADEK